MQKSSKGGTAYEHRFPGLRHQTPSCQCQYSFHFLAPSEGQRGFWGESNWYRGNPSLRHQEWKMRIHLICERLLKQQVRILLVRKAFKARERIFWTNSSVKTKAKWKFFGSSHNTHGENIIHFVCWQCRGLQATQTPVAIIGFVFDAFCHFVLWIKMHLGFAKLAAAVDLKIAMLWISKKKSDNGNYCYCWYIYFPSLYFD